nr:hypothetical protein [Tanacetum cinerariifolium]
DKAPVYDTNDSAEVHLNDNYYDNEIFNMFTQEEQYMDLLEPIPEPQLVPQNDNHVTSVAPSMVQSRGTVETSFAPNEETCTHQETVYRNLVDHVAQEKYDKLEKCYQRSVYQEQCLTKKINALHLSSAKQITTLNDEISNLNRQLSKEKSSIFSLMEEKKRLKHDFKNQKDKFLDKEVYLEARIKDLKNIMLKSHDIMSIVQNGFVDVPSDLRTELDRTKEKLELCILKKVERLQAQLRDHKGKSSDTPNALNTYDPLNQKLESKIIELKFQVVNYEREISHLKATYKNLFDSINSNREHAKIHDLIYENAQLRAWGFENTSEPMKNIPGTSVTPHVNKSKLSACTLLARTRRSQPKGKIRNVRVPSASKSSEVKKNVTVEEHRRTLLLSRNQKTMSSECNNIKLAIQNDKSESVCANCKKCLVTVNHDAGAVVAVKVTGHRLLAAVGSGDGGCGRGGSIIPAMLRRAPSSSSAKHHHSRHHLLTMLPPLPQSPSPLPTAANNRRPVTFTATTAPPIKTPPSSPPSTSPPHHHLLLVTITISSLNPPTPPSLHLVLQPVRVCLDILVFG